MIVILEKYSAKKNCSFTMLGQIGFLKKNIEIFFTVHGARLIYPKRGVLAYYPFF